MLIVIEGVDGAGKSTLVEAIQDFRPRMQTFHKGPIKRSPLIEYESCLDEYYPGDQHDIVCDRWHIGELVYGPMLRGESKLSEASLEHIELFLESRGALKTWVQTPLPIVMERIGTRGDDLIGREKIPLLWDWYQRFLTDQHGWWPVTGLTANVELIRSMTKAAAAKEHSAVWLNRFRRDYIGAPQVEVLVLATNYRDPSGAVKWAAPFKPYTDTFGDRLFTAINRAGVPRRYGVAAANAPELERLLIDLSYKHVVICDPSALEAYEAVSDGVPYTFVPPYAGELSVAQTMKEFL